MCARHCRCCPSSLTPFADGGGADARFRRLGSLALAAPGRLIVADAGNALVRLVGARPQVEWRPPASPRIAPRFDADLFASRPLLWPLEPMDGPHEIAGTLGEARGGEGGERFHAGIDVRAHEGTPVRAVRDGLVSAPLGAAEFGTLGESLRIGPVTYVHLRVGRERRGPVFDESRFAGSYDPAGILVGMRVKRGARFATGEAVGTVNAFNHVHLNVGWPGEEHNPLLLRLVRLLVDLMDREQLDAPVYPVKSLPAPPIGMSDDGPRDNNISAVTGLPAIVLPAGMTAVGLPIAMEILGRPFSESRLIELAHACEQASRARVAPRTTPALSGNVFVF